MYIYEWTYVNNYVHIRDEYKDIKTHMNHAYFKGSGHSN